MEVAMRWIFVFLSGALLGVVAASVYHAGVDVSSPPGAAAARPDAAAAGITETAALRARVAQLEEETGKAQPPEGASAAVEGGEGGASAIVPAVAEAAKGATPDVESLNKLLEEKNLSALAGAVEQLLLSGEDGFQVVLEFLRGQATSQNYALSGSSGLPFTLLTALLRQEGKAAEFTRFVFSSTDRAKDFMVRDQMLRLLPSFLAFTGDRQSQLRRDLEETLLGDIEQGEANTNAWRSVQTLNEMGTEVPMESLEAILMDPQKKNSRWLALQQLSRRGDATAVDLISRYLGSIQDPKDWQARQALQTLGQMDTPEAQSALVRYLSSPAKELRETATMAYFSKPRDINSLDIASEFLKSDADANQRRMLVWQIRSASREIFDALQGDADAYPDEVKEALKKEGPTFRLSSSGGGTTIVVPGGGGAAEVKIQMETK